MIKRPRHLRDDRLVESYFAGRWGETVDPPTEDHLSECPACTTRYSEIAEWLDTLREEAEASADAIFTPERLLAQQHHLARRLGHIGRAARVITFPNAFAKATLAPATSHAASRWIAAAAAAGLFIGVALGASYKAPWTGGPVRSARTVTRPAPAAAAADLTAPSAIVDTIQPDSAADDAFLSELELALDRPRSRELLAYDALTPHVREVREIR